MTTIVIIGLMIGMLVLGFVNGVLAESAYNITGRLYAPRRQFRAWRMAVAAKLRSRFQAWRRR